MANSEDRAFSPRSHIGRLSSLDKGKQPAIEEPVVTQASTPAAPRAQKSVNIDLGPYRMRCLIECLHYQGDLSVVRPFDSLTLGVALKELGMTHQIPHVDISPILASAKYVNEDGFVNIGQIQKFAEDHDLDKEIREYLKCKMIGEKYFPDPRGKLGKFFAALEESYPGTSLPNSEPNTEAELL